MPPFCDLLLASNTRFAILIFRLSYMFLLTAAAWPAFGIPLSTYYRPGDFDLIPYVAYPPFFSPFLTPIPKPAAAILEDSP
ncbi:hypothetical protein B0H12DRAFT_1231743 [Mycena haematopus]|nr:hypothetical protein B0H12DRAFT_1231743 [Mycena haematopus]